MAKRPTPTQIRENYAPQVRECSLSQLATMIRGELEPKWIGEALVPLAIEEAERRGIEYPPFWALFV